MKSDARIAFVLDTLPSIGGGEKVLFAALEAYPHADIFTLIYNKKVFDDSPIAKRIVNTSWLDALPFAHTRHRYLLPLMPAAIERINLHDYDTIVSFNYAVANGAKNHNGARHVSYTHTPMRYAWTDARLTTNPLFGWMMRLFRAWDRRAASRVHAFATNSETVSRRIRRAYGRDARVIHPPVETDRFRPSANREDYFITVTRLVPHKKIDLFVQAFNQLNLPLVVIGDGPELPRLKAMANSNIKLLGFQSDEAVAELLGKARGFVCAAEEDFGIAIVEAEAAGCPVIAYGAGGARETVIENETGIFFDEQSMESLSEAVQRFQKISSSFSTDRIAKNAQRFNKPRFIREFKEFVGSLQCSVGV
ncbi:MAG: D-inositol-3-phosphate glycosyltransferase [Anaerolineales bacterium]|nr:D-inositol-3-phosphate glycosyltransferase [Anaerolineales bacterium]